MSATVHLLRPTMSARCIRAVGTIVRLKSDLGSLEPKLLGFDWHQQWCKETILCSDRLLREAEKALSSKDEKLAYSKLHICRSQLYAVRREVLSTLAIMGKGRKTAKREG